MRDDRDPLLCSQPALRFLVDNGVSVQLRLTGASMAPTLPRGAVLRIAAIEPFAVLDAGDVVVIATAAGEEVIVHRVLQVFVEAGRDFIIHQGDAPGTTFAVAAREQVLARVTAVDEAASDVFRPIGPGNLRRFTARRLVCLGYLLARRLVGAEGLPTRSLRHAREGFRSMARRWTNLPGIQIGLTLRLDLPARSRALTVLTPGIAVREVSRCDLEDVLCGHPALGRAPHDVDNVAPLGWRCFVATIDGRPAHVSFVESRPGRPLLFGAVTEPDARRRGLFHATVGLIARVLEREGAPALWSSVAGENRPSVQAHQAAGFTIVHRSIDIRVGETSARALGRRIVRGE